MISPELSAKDIGRKWEKNASSNNRTGRNYIPVSLHPRRPSAHGLPRSIGTKTMHWTQKNQGSSYEFVGLSELQFLYLDRIYRIDWIYCFLCFQTKQRNGNPAFSGKEKPKKPIVLLPNDHVASSLCFYCQKNSLEEEFNFLPFFRKGKKS